MTDEERRKNREKVARFRQKRAAEAEELRNEGKYFGIPRRLDTQIVSSVANCLACLAEVTGTSKGILVERALTEYFIKYRELFPIDEGLLQPRRLNEQELLPLDKSGRIFLNSLPTDKPLDFPPKAAR